MAANRQSLDPILKQVHDKPMLQGVYSNVTSPTSQPFIKPAKGEQNSKRSQGALALQGLIGAK